MFNEFASMTGYYVNKTFSKLKNSQSGVVNVIGAGNLNSPNMSVLQPLLAQDAVEGIFWYTFGAGYSGWSSTEFDTYTKKPVIGGRVSLWGNSTSGTMLGVNSVIKRLKTLLQNKEINSNIDDVNGYSLIPVNVWSHSVDDVMTVTFITDARAPPLAVRDAAKLAAAMAVRSVVTAVLALVWL